MPKTSQSDPRRGGILKVLLLIVVVAVAAIVMAVVIVARTIHVKQGSIDRVSIETPAGTMSVQGHKRLDPESVGIPVYPKAYMDSKQDAAGASFEWDSKKDGEVSGFTVVGAEYLTDDSPDKVLAFYKNKLGTWVVSSKSSGETQLEFTDGKWKRVVAIREENGRTHIGIASVGTPAGN